MRVFCLNILFAVFLATPSIDASPPDDLSAFMQELAKDGLGPGSVTLITVDGTTVFQEATGTTTLGGDTPMPLNAIFNIHSMTKPITSVALMQCVEEGLVRLDDPVGNYIPIYAEIDSARPITIRDLLTHTSGIGYGRGHDEVIATSATLKAFVESVASIPLIHQPGERFTYGIGPAIAGRIVEVLRQEDLRTVVRKRILEPLGMHDTGWELSDPDRLVSRAIRVPHSRQTEFGDRATVDETVRLDLEPKWITPWEAARARGVTYGDGGMFSTAVDYTRFARMIVNRGELDGARILAPETVDLMLQDHLPESVSYGQDRKRRFGLGFEVEVDPKSDNAIPGEHGWNGAASTYYFGDSKKRCTAVFMNALMPFDGALKERFTNLARQVVAEQPHKPIVATRDGLVQGVFEKDGRIAVFKGIPYAAPPTGARRWAPPAPPASWEGVRDATEFGSACPQAPGLRSFGKALLSRLGSPKGTINAFPRQDEDCLSLNVWTPTLDANNAAPVLVWIHGGGYRMGGGAFDQSPICNEGVVTVTFNMRLGVLGFFSHPALSKASPTGTSGNQGLQDVVAVLEWVQENIAAFGGDPNRVTVGGLSAGGSAAALLLGVPAAHGLFHGVISVSPAPIGFRHGLEPGIQGQHTAHAYGEMVAMGAGLSPEATVEELQAIPLATLLGVQLGMEAMLMHLDLPFTPRVDGDVLPEPVLDRFARGETPDVPLLIGSASEDGGLVGEAILDRMSRGDFQSHVRRLVGDDAENVLATYPNDSSTLLTTPMAQFTTDWIFGANARTAAATFARGGRTAFLYLNAAGFPEEHPGHQAGAFHGYAFGNGSLNALAWDPGGVFDPLTSRMMQRFGAFIHSGDPNTAALPRWRAYTEATDPYLLLELTGDIPSKGLRSTTLDPLQRAIETRGQ